jgi:hypothetical protein
MHRASLAPMLQPPFTEVLPMFPRRLRRPQPTSRVSPRPLPLATLAAMSGTPPVDRQVILAVQRLGLLLATAAPPAPPPAERPARLLSR